MVLSPVDSVAIFSSLVLCCVHVISAPASCQCAHTGCPVLVQSSQSDGGVPHSFLPVLPSPLLAMLLLASFLPPLLPRCVTLALAIRLVLAENCSLSLVG